MATSTTGIQRSTDALAATSEVILVDYPGRLLGRRTARDDRRDGASHDGFVNTLCLEHIDLLGFSIGGFVAQDVALVRPTLVRRLVLAATGPKGAPGMHGWRKDTAAAARSESRPENLLDIMFAHTETSQAKGKELLGRLLERRDGRDTPTSDRARDGQ